MGLFPYPILTSCFVFPAIGIACGAVPLFLLRTNRLGKDDAQITCLSIGIAMFCMWLMWLCAWMHQWNPIILPYMSHPPVAMDGGDASAVGEHR